MYLPNVVEMLCRVSASSRVLCFQARKWRTCRASLRRSAWRGTRRRRCWRTRATIKTSTSATAMLAPSSCLEFRATTDLPSSCWRSHSHRLPKTLERKDLKPPYCVPSSVASRSFVSGGSATSAPSTDSAGSGGNVNPPPQHSTLKNTWSCCFYSEQLPCDCFS